MRLVRSAERWIAWACHDEIVAPDKWSPAEVHQLHPAEVEAFISAWRAIGQACEHALSDPRYPSEGRAELYEILGAARECAQPHALQHLRRSQATSR